MKILQYMSSVIIPLFILIILLYSIVEKKRTFDIFIEGAKEGLEIVLKIFPSLIGLFVAIGALKSSGILNLIIKILSPLTSIAKIPEQVMPLAILRPISGSASMVIATEIMKTYGVDSIIGKICSTIMGATETTLYTIVIYTGVVKIKKTRFILFAALMGNIVRNTSICRYLANYVAIILLTL